MRSHGIKDFPDPDSQGNVKLNVDGPGSDLDLHNPAYTAADNACKSLRPQAQQSRAPGAKDDNLKYSQCMRSHGIKDFPDPNADGHLDIGQNAPGGDLDPGNPQFKAAEDACKQFQPAGGPGEGLDTAGGGS
ncbi:MAG: hypothetical protein HOV87_11740 [Catenulispora sp.]|nr:hypothetical protein [Catenulispora sp.]